MKCLALVRLILAIARVMQATPKRGSRYSETHARYSEHGADAQLRPDSMIEFEDECFSNWIIIRSLKQDFGPIYCVFLLTHI